MKCYDCIHNMKVSMAVMRDNVDERTAARDIVYIRECLINKDVYASVIKKIPRNFKSMLVKETDDLLIKHCTMHEQRSIKEDSPSVSSMQLAHELGNSHVDPASTPSIQWERILNRLNLNGFTIVRREIDD